MKIIARRLAHTPLTLIAAALLCLFLTPSTAVADLSEEEARERFQQGREYFEDGDYLEAAAIFEEVYEVLGAVALLYNTGQAYYRADRLAEAEEFFQTYLQEASSPPNEDEVVDLIIDIQEQRAAREATVVIESTPEGVQVFVDDGDDPYCTAPCEFTIDPGEYTLRAEAEGFQPLQKAMTLDVRDSQEFNLELDPVTRYGSLRIHTGEGSATARIDGQTYRLPHVDPIELAEGHYDIHLDVDGHELTHSLDIAADDTANLFIPTDHIGSGGLSNRQSAAIGLGGAGTALAVAAAITGSQASSTHSDLEAQQQSLGGVDPSLLSAGQRQSDLSTTLWIGAFSAIGAGAGLWTWDWWDSRSSSSDAPLEPSDDSSDHDNDVDNDVDVDLL